jgi:hypothetical protein
MRKSNISLIGAAAALAAVMALPAVAAADSHEDAKVRVGHFSPDAPAVDIYVNGEIFAGLEDVEFGTLSGYVPVPADTYSVAVVLADADPAEGTVIGPADIPLAAGSSTTIAATGFAGGEEPALGPVILTDDFVLEEGMAQVRVGHYSPDAPAVDIYVNGEIFAGLEDVPFGVISPYVSVPADTYSVAVVVADMDPAEGTVIGPADIALESNTAATIFAIGSAADENLPALQPYIAVDGTADEMMAEEMAEEEMAEE